MDRREFWIGLRRVNDDSFAWITEEETSYTNWGYGEHNNYVTFEFEGENSAAMRPDWNDYHEDNTASIAGYICEWDISNGD